MHPFDCTHVSILETQANTQGSQHKLHTHDAHHLCRGKSCRPITQCHALNEPDSPEQGHEAQHQALCCLERLLWALAALQAGQLDWC